MTKKIMSMSYVVLILLLVSMIPFLPNMVSADPAAMKIYIDPPSIIDPTLLPEKNFTIDVKIRDAANVGGVEFRLSWNNAILEGVSIELPTGHFMTPDSDAGNLWIITKAIYASYANYAVTYYNMTKAIEKGYAPKSGNGTLAKITLKVKGTGSNIIDLIDSIIGDPGGNPLPHDAIDGYFKNSPPLLGDINGDGTVNILDAIILAKAFGSKPGDPNWDSRADLNKDSVVNILDAIKLAENFGKSET